MAEKMTIYDIAREAGVAPSTVSRVLTGHPNVSTKTREKVRSIIDRRHFTPNLSAQALEQNKQRLKTIGVIMPEVTDNYSGKILCAATREARRLGYETLLFQLPIGEKYDIGEIVDQLIRRRLDGALYSGGVLEVGRSDLPGALNRLMEYMPLVAISPPIEGINCTFLHNDLETTLYHAVQHLYMLGHRRTAFIGGASTMRDSGARSCGYLRAVRELGLKDIPSYRGEGGFTAESGEIAVLRLFSEKSGADRPSAILAFSDLVALGALKQLHTMGLRVPEDVAIIGCDNTFFSPYTVPPLTTIDLFSEERARTAVDELIACSSESTPKPPFTLVRAPAFIVRESCGVMLGQRENL
jgi:DNA-binding LacI/PurR family transcriptional regulator